MVDTYLNVSFSFLEAHSKPAETLKLPPFVFPPQFNFFVCCLEKAKNLAKALKWP